MAFYEFHASPADIQQTEHRKTFLITEHFNNILGTGIT